MYKKLQNKILELESQWEKRSKRLESLMRDVEKSLIEMDPIDVDSSVDLGKIARAMILSARANEIDICRAELQEIIHSLAIKNSV